MDSAADYRKRSLLKAPVARNLDPLGVLQYVLTDLLGF